MTAALPEGPAFAYDPVALARERRPRMLISLLLGSALVPLLFLLVGSLVRILPAERVIEIRMPTSTFDAPSQVTPAAIPPPARTPSASIRSGEVGVPIPATFEPPASDSWSPAGDEETATPPTETGGIVLGGGSHESDVPMNHPGQQQFDGQLPNPVRAVKPDYPELARDAHLEGLVVVFALVGRDGRVLEVRLDPEWHVPLLDSAALEAARRWRFEPALMGGHPVAAWVSVPFRFVLHGGE